MLWVLARRIKRSYALTALSTDLQQGSFLDLSGIVSFSAVLVICFVSIFLNVRLAERMQQLQDNDMKYRYLLMQRQADGETFDMLENKFKWQRDNDFIRSLTDSVIDFEYHIQKQAEALERARLLNEQAEQLKKEADKLGKP